MTILYNPHQILWAFKMQEGQTSCHHSKSIQFSIVHEEDWNTLKHHLKLLLQKPLFEVYRYLQNTFRSELAKFVSWLSHFQMTLHIK